jgi:hypothetical protein
MGDENASGSTQACASMFRELERLRAELMATLGGPMQPVAPMRSANELP